MNLFPSEQEQIEAISIAEDSPSAFSIGEKARVTEEDIRNAVSMNRHVNARIRIAEHFSQHLGKDANVKFLKNEFGTGGGSFSFADGSNGDYWTDRKGIGFSKSFRSHNKPDVRIKWPEVERRISYMVAADTYLTEEDRTIIEARSHIDEAPIQPLNEIFSENIDDLRYWVMNDIKVHNTIFQWSQNRVPYDAMLKKLKKGISQQIHTHRFDNIPLHQAHNTSEAFREQVLNHLLDMANEQANEWREEAKEQVAEEVQRSLLEEAAIAQPVAERKLSDMLGIEGEEAAEKETVPEKMEAAQPASPAPVFFVDWETAKADFDLSRYKDRDTLGYNKDGVKYTLGMLGNQPYVTQSTTITPWGDVLGDSEIPAELHNQIVAYRNGELSDEDVRENYLKIISPEKAAQDAIADELPPIGNFRITDDDLGAGGAKSKYAANIAAIRTLKTIEAEERSATPEEQEILHRYVGWGGIPQAFSSEHENWSKEYQELTEILTPEEFDAARASTLNAHYTSPTVIKAMYEPLKKAGFKAGNILEPAMGVGNFFGLLPEEMEKSKLYGVELDSITGRIAKQLYPDANINISGYENTSLPDNFFDLAIGNIPFGGYSVPDRKYDKHHFLIHDYFFGKTIDQVRPGGVIAFISSSGTLDKQNSSVRKYIAQRADLLGAVRLPNDAFKKNAGTEVTTDIIFLQKRDHIVDLEPDWVGVGETDAGVPLNNYFLENPQMVLGNMAFSKKMYGGEKDTTCHSIEGAVLEEQLAQAMEHIIIPEPPPIEIDELLNADEVDTLPLIPADPDVRNFSFTEIEGNLYFRENAWMNPVQLPEATEARVRGMIQLRDTTRELLAAQLENQPDEAIRELQSRLNDGYDTFSKKHGLINSQGNKRAFEQDSSYALLCSLEHLDEEGKLKAKADMFSKRTIRAAEPVSHVDTASEALALSIGERACVDLEYMSQLTGLPQEKLLEDLQSVVFLNVGRASSQNQAYVTADEYLSGNVREKLALARATAEVNPALSVNVQALELVQPKDLMAAEIEVRMGMEWIDMKYYQQFMTELLQTPRSSDIKIQYSPSTNVWRVSNKNNVNYSDVLANITYGSKRRNAYHLIEDALNQKSPRVFDINMVDGKEVRELNGKETEIAQEKQNQIKEAFKDWVFKDPQRREDLCKLYNKRFNSTRPREYNGDHIRFNGMNPEIELRQHQKNAIARVLYGGNSLLAHCVGAGKTFEMVAASMESKRLGLCQKSLFVVPNHLTEQWASEFLTLYPAANVLVSTKKDFEPANRKKFCARIATGDYDAVIIGHSQFEKIPISQERQEAMLHKQIDEISESVEQIKRDRGEKFTIKQMEKTKASLQARLKKLAAEHKKDNVVTFEELGVDRLFVDEAHNYKNLFIHTKMRNVAGISQTEAQKSSDMFMKCQYMDELTGGKGVVFATGTPISNSMVELFTMMRYLQHNLLDKLGLLHFDSWAAQFGETVTELELTPEGTGLRPKERFSRFFNLPELINHWKEVADIQTADMLDLDVPEAEFITEVTPASELQKEMVASLAERAEQIRGRMVDPKSDNMLKITSDGRKLALDQRLHNDLLPDDPGSKINKVVSNVLQVWKDSEEIKGAQLIFSDLSTPKGKNTLQKIGDGIADAFGQAKAFLTGEDAPEKKNAFNVYDNIKAKLIAQGVPEQEIAFIHDATTEKKKADLFAKVRSGKVRVLLGSTAKMGAGTNAQDRLVALHHVDCPWRPSDIEQREGRIIRQGNMNEKVKIFRYVTEGTFDSYTWSIVEKKQKFIGQIMTSKSPVRSFEDTDETALSYAEVKALASGDPRIMEKMNLDADVSKLKVRKANHQSQQYQLEDNLALHFPARLKQAEQNLVGAKSDTERLHNAPVRGEDEFHGMVVNDVFFAKKSDAGEALLKCCQRIDPKVGDLAIGLYRGFDMSLSYDAVFKTFSLHLQGDSKHSVPLGSDVHGNITRINNALEKIPGEITTYEGQIENISSQIRSAKLELGKPFPQEAELQEKMKRLNSLNVALSTKVDSREENTGEKESIVKKLKENEGLVAPPSSAQQVTAGRSL